jgi:uncharacterized protein (DUF1786 family)
MNTTNKFLGITMNWTPAAMEVAEETGLRHAEVADEIERVRNGELTREALLARCLDGADEDRVAGWTEYVDAVVAAAEAPTA